MKIESLLVMALVWGTVAIGATNDVDLLSSARDLEKRYSEFQSHYLPIIPPSHDEMFLQPDGPLLLFDSSGFKKRFLDNLIGEQHPVFGEPIYTIFAMEDALDRCVNIYAEDLTFLARVKRHKWYDSVAWAAVKYGVNLSEWHLNIYKPARMIAEFKIIPVGYYEDHNVALEEMELMSVRAMPMMMAISIPSVITEFRIIQDGTNLKVSLPDQFVGADLAFERSTNLVVGTWGVVLETNVLVNGVMDLGMSDLSDLQGEMVITTNLTNIVNSLDGTTNYIAGTVTTNYVSPPVTAFYRISARSEVDSDGDGLDNVTEYDVGTEYQNTDTDSDGLDDFSEVVIWRTDPRWWDFDRDKISDGDEILLGLNPTNRNAEFLVTTVALPDCFVNDEYSSAQLTALNGDLPYTWKVLGLFEIFDEVSAVNSFSEAGSAKGWTADDGKWLLEFPFSFPFYGTNYTSCWVDSNGRIIFDDYIGSDPNPSDSKFSNTAMLAVLWDDLKTEPGDIYVEQEESCVTIRWDGGYYFDGLYGDISFSATLFSDGMILLKYGGGNGSGGYIGVSSGASGHNQKSIFSQNGNMDNSDDIVLTPVASEGTMPDGFQLSSNGIVSGYPLEVNQHEIHVFAEDFSGETASRKLSLNVVPPFGITHNNPPGPIVPVYDDEWMDFSVVITNPSNQGIAHHWYWDDELQTGNLNTFTVTSNLSDVGIHTLEVLVSNENYNVSEQWAVEVLEQDTDRDGMPDSWEVLNGFDPDDQNDGQNDEDEDGLTNQEEYSCAADPYESDSDSDGVIDGMDRYPTVSGPEIILNVPSPGTVQTNADVWVSGFVSFTGGVQSVSVNGFSSKLTAVSNGYEFAVEVPFADDGLQELDIRAVGGPEDSEIESILSEYVNLDAFTPELILLAPTDGDTVDDGFVHFTVLSDDLAPVIIGGEEAVRNGQLSYAWVELSGGTNTLLVQSEDSLGRKAELSVTLLCNVSGDPSPEAPQDRDGDGVLDQNDFSPNDPEVHSACSIISHLNGQTIRIESLPESYEAGRIVEVFGQAPAGQHVKLNVKGLNAPWGTDWTHSCIADRSGEFRCGIELCPGVNEITLSSGQSRGVFYLRMVVDPPDVRFVVEYSHPKAMDNYRVSYVRWESFLLYTGDRDKLNINSDQFETEFNNNDYWSDSGEIVAALPGICSFTQCHDGEVFPYSGDWGGYDGPPVSSYPKVKCTIKAFVENRLVKTVKETLTPVSIIDWFWEGFGEEFSICYVPLTTQMCLGIHSGEYAGAFVVEDGRRKPCTQGEFLGDGWGSRGDDMFGLCGPEGAGPVYLTAGETARFSNRVKLSDDDVYTGQWEPREGSTLACWKVEGVDGAGAATNALIDASGCFTSYTSGHYRVVMMTPLYSSGIDEYPENDPDPIDVYVFDPPKLVPNYDRDGVIGSNDCIRAENLEPFRFWVNDDNDDHNSEVSGNDAPGISSVDEQDWFNGFVDGMRDLIDFFPVKIELDEMLCDRTKFSYYLRNKDEALNFAYTYISSENVMSYLLDPVIAQSLFDPALVTSRVEAEGIELVDPGFLTRLESDQEAVLLLEGSYLGTKEPLVFEVRDKNSGALISSAELQLSISRVEEMCRFHTLRGDGRASVLGEPSNCPDWLTSGKDFVFVHGYNVDADSGDGTHAEVFKRMYQSGYQGRFWGVSWYGNVSDALPGDGSSHYHNSVVEAFSAAQGLRAFLEGFSSPPDLAAHSLGNGVVGIALNDAEGSGNLIRNYFALDAAMSLEAYGETNTVSHMTFNNAINVADDDTTAVDMRTWSEYGDEVWASEWYRLFDASDARSTLTWRNRIADVTDRVESAYNFYFSTEEVLRVDDGCIGYMSAAIDAGYYSWQIQEWYKGLKADRWWLDNSLASWIAGGSSEQCGWAFTRDNNSQNRRFVYDDSYYSLQTPEWVNGQLTTNSVAYKDSLKTDPFFKADPSILFTASGNNFVNSFVTDQVAHLDYTESWLSNVLVRDWLLAKAFPARSRPMGASPIALGTGWEGSYDMSTILKIHGWPRTTKYLEDPEWRHGDFKDVAYPYVQELYKKWVELSE